MKAESKYLLDYLEHLEEIISIHAKKCRLKKYLIYRDGYLYTATDHYSDVERLCSNYAGLYTYELNKL
jgi:hypothetical protein